MTNIIRSLSFAIVQAIYPLIPDLYGVVMDLASNRYFTTEAIRTLSGNIYIVISVCMLFALGIKLISAIVNPDMLTDQKKGVKSVAMHAIFAVFLIVLIPIGFDKLYEVQGDVVENQLIEKIVLGMDTDEDSEPGQILAAYAFASFCQPNENVSVEALSSSGSDLYNKAITEDISKIKEMDGVINSKTDGVYDLEYNAIISPAVGIYLIYQLIMMAMDMALRTIKLGVLQLITPVILCAYVVAGTDILQKWAKMVISTFVLLFLKIAMISFMIYGLSLLPDFLDNFSDKSFWYRGFLRLFMIIGLLQLIKQIPDIINNIFGTSIKSRGGIRGRLGEMAAVGDLAQRGWDQLRQHPLQTAQRLVSAPLSAVGGLATHTAAAIHSGINRGRETARRITDQHGRAAGLRGFAVGAAQSLAGIATAGGAAWRAGRQGMQNGNLRGIGGARQRYMETHPADSTFGGRLLDTITEGAGYGTRKSRQEEAAKYLTYRDPDGNEQRMSVEDLNNMRSQNEVITQQRNTIRDAAVDAITADDSNLRLTVAGIGTGNYQQLVHQLEAMRGIQLRQNAGENDAAYAARVQAHQQHLTDLENNLINTRNNARDAIIDYAGAHNGDFEHINGQTINGFTFEAIAAGNAISGRDSGIIGTTLNTLNQMGHHIGSNQELNDLNQAAQDNLNAINTSLQSHQQQVYEEQNSPEGRHIKADHDAVNAHNNNNGGNNGGNGH